MDGTRRSWPSLIIQRKGRSWPSTTPARPAEVAVGDATFTAPAKTAILGQNPIARRASFGI